MALFYLLILSLALTQHYALAYTVGGVTTEKLLGALCLLIALFHVLRKGKASEAFFQRGTILCVAYFILAMLSYLIAYGSAWSSQGAQNNVLSILFLLLVTIIMVDSVARLHSALLMMVGSVAIASFYVVREWMQWGHAIAGYRPGGVSGDANYFGTAAATCLPLVLVLIQVCRIKWERYYLIGCFILILFAFLLAASRGSLVGLSAGFLLVLTRSRKKLRNVVLAAALVIPLLAVAPTSFGQRLLNPGGGDNQAVAARETTWRAGWSMFKDHPLVGVGLSRFKTVVLQYEDTTAGALQVQSLAHNTYIEVAAEQGLLGFIPFMGTLIAAFLMLGKAARMTANIEPRFLNRACIGLQAALLAAWVGAFFISAWWFRFYWFPVFLAICMRPIALSAIRRYKAATMARTQLNRNRIKDLEWACVDVNH
jgi:O-antigen ligase